MRFRTFTKTAALILLDARVCLTVVAAMLAVLCGGCGIQRTLRRTVRRLARLNASHDAIFG